MHDTKTPVVVGTANMSLNILFSLTLPAVFLSWGWMPHGALALSNTIATSLEAITLLILMRRRLKGLEGGYVWSGIFKSSLATAAMIAALWGWLVWVRESSVWLVGLGGIAIGGAVYAVLMLVLRVEEVQIAMRYMAAWISRRQASQN
jgi:putative peptidoglycan lipid II flippase